MYPVTPPSYNYSNNTMVQKSYLNQQNLQPTPPPQLSLPPTPPQIVTPHQSILINSNPNYGINNSYMHQQNPPSQNQYYEMNGSNSGFYPNQSNTISGPAGVGPSNRFKNINDEPEHLQINRTLG